MNHPSYGFQRSDRLQAGRPFVSDRHTNHSHAAHEYEGRSEFRRPGEARSAAARISHLLVHARTMILASPHSTPPDATARVPKRGLPSRVTTAFAPNARPLDVVT